MPPIIYLHGFASSPQSSKAKYFQEHFPSLIVPDLNQGDFSTLTVSRQLEQVGALLTEPSVIIGSSLGGLTAALLAEKYPEMVKKIVLMAPAFRFTRNWRKRLGEQTIMRWQKDNSLPIFHYSYQREIPLHYAFFADAEEYDQYTFENQIPTLILHGRNDEVVPIQVSENYAAARPWVKFVPLDSDHSLGDRQGELLTETAAFLAESP